METMQNFYILLIVFLLVVFIGNMFKTTKLESKKKREKELKIIDYEIQSKQKVLNHLYEQLDNQKIDNLTSLSKIETDVLDIYENSNIKIPVDIIEELSRMKLQSEKEILEYIENQRYFWKLENTKKPYVRK